MPLTRTSELRTYLAFMIAPHSFVALVRLKSCPMAPVRRSPPSLRRVRHDPDTFIDANPPRPLACAAMAITIATWNINSVRLRVEVVKKFLRVADPDVLCLQETKTPDEHFPREAFAEAG